ncbi:MAG: DUF4271 domain-containing protein [Bacteroidetes bacterium]|nr:DUF4271 domain-containing protein [Bacteroidota bacterium]
MKSELRRFRILFLLIFVTGSGVNNLFAQDSAIQIAGVDSAIMLVAPDTASADTVHKQKSIEPVPVLRQNRPKWYIFLFSLVILTVVGMLRNYNGVRHRLAFFSYFSSPKNENELLEDTFGIDIYQIAEILVSILLMGWLIYLFNPFDLNFTLTGEGSRLVLWLVLVGLTYSLKYFIHYIVGLILQSDRLSKLIVFSQSNMMYVLSLVIFPLLLFYYYAPEPELKIWLQTGILVLVIVHLILRLIKSFRIYLHLFPFSRVYIFLYLCALEILPLMVLVHFIVVR